MPFIFGLQKILIGVSLVLLAGIAIAGRFGGVGFAVMGILYQISFGAVFLVMIVRPLADIFDTQLWLRRLIILRKGFGILSASIIVGFMLSSILSPDSTYLASIATAHYWSLNKYVLFAHLGDISGLILLLTSNQFSQKLLKQNWKKVQRLSYVYFYAGGIYHQYVDPDSLMALYAMFIMTGLTISAWAIKIARRMPVAVGV